MRVARTRAIILGLAHLERMATYVRQHGAIDVSPETRAIAALLASHGRGDLQTYRRFLDALAAWHPEAFRGVRSTVYRSNELHAAMLNIHKDLRTGGPGLDREVVDARVHGKVRRTPEIIDRLRLPTDLAQLGERFAIETLNEPVERPLQESGAGQPVWVVTLCGVPRQIDVKRWGYIRNVEGLGAVSRPAVTIATLDHPLWSGVTGNQFRRCIIPFTAFRQGGRWVEVAGEEVAGFAGFQQPSLQGPECVVMTCPANPAIGGLGATQMPVILMREDEERWLRVAQWREVEDLVAPLPFQLTRVLAE